MRVAIDESSFPVNYNFVTAMLNFSEADIWRVVQAEGVASILSDVPQEPVPPPLNTETVLENESVRLRRVAISDSSQIIEIFSTRIARLLGRTTSFETEEEVRAVIENLLLLNSLGLHHTFSIEEKTSGMVIGTTELRGFDLANKTCVLGTWLGEAFWGKNLGFKARTLLFRYAFGQLDQCRIEAGVRSDNYRAVGALLRLGFQIEGRLRNRVSFSGKRHDYWLLGLLRSDLTKYLPT